MFAMQFGDSIYHGYTKHCWNRQKLQKDTKSDNTDGVLGAKHM